MSAIAGVAALILAALPGDAAAQPTRARAPFVIRIGVEVIQIDAVVTDEKGRHVTDLGASDFELLQDGVAQTISHCEYVPVTADTATPAEPTPAAAPATGASPLPQPDEIRRTIALLVTRPRLDQVDQRTQVREALRQFIEKDMGPGDLAAIIFTNPWTTGDQLPLPQCFTTDKRVLLAAVDTLNEVSYSQWQQQVMSQVDASSLDRAGMPAPETDVREDEAFEIPQLDQMATLMRVMAELPGRKTLMYLSNGIHVPEVKTGSDQGSLGGDSFPFRTYDAQLRRLTDIAHRAGVVLYAADMGGITTGGPLASNPNPRSMSGTIAAVRGRIRAGVDAAVDHMIPTDMATATGGFAFRHNDLAAGVHEAVEDQRGYYLLGYTPPAGGFKPNRREADFHKIELRVKRPDLRVRTRKGFFGTPQVETPAPGGDALAAALVSPLASTELGLRLTPSFAHDAARGSLIRSLVHIDGRQLAFTPEPDGRARATVALLAVAFDSSSTPIAKIKRDVTVRVPADALGQLEPTGLYLDVVLPVPRPGTYQVRVAARDVASGRVDKAAGVVQVPDLGGKALTLSGLLVSTRSRLAREVGDALAEGEAGGLLPEAGASPARRAFRAGEAMSYWFAAYNVTPQGPGVSTDGRIELLHDGQAVSSQPLPPPRPSLPARAKARGPRSADVRGWLTLPADLTPGLYSAEVSLREERAGKDSAVAIQSVDFEIVQ